MPSSGEALHQSSRQWTSGNQVCDRPHADLLFRYFQADMDQPQAPSDDGCSRVSHRRRIVRILTTIALAVTTLVGLTYSSIRSVQGVTSRSSSRHQVQWQQDVSYWSCLAIEARGLVVPGERVEIDKQGLASKVILEKTVGGWTRLVSSAQNPSAILALENDHSERSCLGSVVVEYPPGSRLRGPPEKIGSGGSDPGTNSLPATPL